MFSWYTKQSPAEKLSRTIAKYIKGPSAIVKRQTLKTEVGDAIQDCSQYLK